MSQPIDDGKFEVKKDGLDAVILFPSLGTPALVDTSKKLTVIVALHENSITKLAELEGKSFTQPGEKVGEKGALKMHSHLFLMDWKSNHPQANNEQSYLAHFQSITANSFLIYQSHTRAREKFNTDYDVWYLGRLEKENIQPLHIFTRVRGENTPFGVLDESAMSLYQSKKYTYLFQMEFRNFESAALGTGNIQELLELVWVWGDEAGVSSNRSDTYEKPADTVLITNWEENLGTHKNGGGGLFWGGKPILEKDTTFKREYRTRNAWLPDSNEELSMYPLLHPGGRAVDKAYEKERLPAASQKNTHFLMARHPVFVCVKEKLDIGIIGDLHISTKQALYTQTNCRVIPGASDVDSPNLGLTFNEFLSSSRRVLDEVCARSDILVIVGDIIDHDKNLHPGRCTDEVERTGQLWEIVNFEEHKEYYPRFIDSIILQELLLLCMDKGTPVFFITGNHEGYQEPYGISPRAFSVDAARVNEGIPLDHNLSLYEAILLYGKHYYKCREIFKNFDDDVISSYYQWFSPWHDVSIPHGKYNFIFLGWGKEEGYIKTTLEGGKSLPRAYTPMTDAQLKLLRFAANETGVKTNVLFSHFTYVSYDSLLALKDTEGNPCAATITIGMSNLYEAGTEAFAASVLTPVPNLKYGLMAGGGALQYMGERESAFCSTNIGSFINNLEETWSLLSSNRIHYTVSGHAHRSCVYEIRNATPGATNIAVAPVAHSGALLPEEFILPSTRTSCIVTGSAGPISRQNVEGEFGGMGLDAPQGMVLSLAKNSVQVVRPQPRLPRLAALAGGFSVLYDGLPFGDALKTKDGQFYAEINEAWLHAFAGFPFSYLKLYCVDKKEGKPLAQFFQLNVSHVEEKNVYFKETSEQVKIFIDGRLNKFPDSEELSDGLFLSLHFSSDRLGTKYIENYDTTHPFIVYVKLTSDWLWRDEIEIQSYEIPHFYFYRKFKEYK